MTTTVYQKFISRYAEIFTLVEMTEGTDGHFEVIPAAKFNKMDPEECDDLIQELWASENEKASWSDDEDPFDAEDARAAAHQEWDEIDSDLNKMGM